ncbi:mitogen-activated protein kinase kinase kinase SSK22 ASCRUDRAFT_7628 [Ascoidea rubescens DSM 1968]|uniref:Protein kinase domain-containing protein n=1 Tax=Ascoidea rubescens DSM 1968 TaxID=1344418 RepID=A0A1D2VIB2_9ASCO|nr:hypothetical protein ASCRUDRAFT_7628 [Ascoidea rubescens DSM 1968]ODV61391.1 hypothetical protein ASCRUDRAFT_7628 [Ascoidea rubescens DSM 1968]
MSYKFPSLPHKSPNQKNKNDKNDKKKLYPIQRFSDDTYNNLNSKYNSIFQNVDKDIKSENELIQLHNNQIVSQSERSNNPNPNDNNHSSVTDNSQSNEILKKDQIIEDVFYTKSSDELIKININELNRDPDLKCSILTSGEIRFHTDPLKDKKIRERFEWESMVHSVVTGHFINLEKDKFAKSFLRDDNKSIIKNALSKNIWIELKANTYRRTTEQQSKLINNRRKFADSIFDKISNFKFQPVTYPSYSSTISKSKPNNQESTQAIIDNSDSNQIGINQESLTHQNNSTNKNTRANRNKKNEKAPNEELLQSKSQKSKRNLHAKAKKANIFIECENPYINDYFQKNDEYEKETDLIFDDQKPQTNYKVFQELTLEEVDRILDDYDKCEELWETSTEMISDKPICNTTVFKLKLKALRTWKTNLLLFQNEKDNIKRWLGETDFTKLKFNSNDKYTIDKILKLVDGNPSNFFDSGVHHRFRAKVLRILGHWSLETKEAYIVYKDQYREMNLPNNLDEFISFVTLPAKILKELIQLRVSNFEQINNVSLRRKLVNVAEFDALSADIKSYTRLAIEIKSTLNNFLRPQRNWVISSYLGDDYDKTLLSSVKSYFKMLNQKLLDRSIREDTFNTFRESEELEHEWRFFKDIGYAFDLVNSVDIVLPYIKIFSHLSMRLNLFLENQLRDENPNITSYTASKSSPYPNLFKGGLVPEKLIKLMEAENKNKNGKKIKPKENKIETLNKELVTRYTSVAEGFSNFKKSLDIIDSRLETVLNNSSLIRLKCLNSRFLEFLKQKNHYLVKIGKKNENFEFDFDNKTEDVSLYLFCNESATKSEISIVKAILGSNICCSRVRPNFTDLLNAKNPFTLRENQFPKKKAFSDHQEYLIMIPLKKNFTWKGNVVKINLDHIASITKSDFTVPKIFNISSNNCLLITHGLVNTLESAKYHFLENVKTFEDENFILSENKPMTNSKDYLTIESDLIKFSGIDTCSIEAIGKEFAGSKKYSDMMMIQLLQNLPEIRKKYKDCTNKEPLQFLYVFVRKYVLEGFSKIANINKKRILDHLLVASLDWLNFIVEDCNPFDKSTFQWAIATIEFTHWFLQNYGIHRLPDEKFKLYKFNVANCVSILVINFDVLGARAEYNQRLLNLDQVGKKDNQGKDEDIVALKSKERMKLISELEFNRDSMAIKHGEIGQVMEVSRPVTKYIDSLLKKYLQFAHQWHKGPLIGRGSFGSVYQGVDLETMTSLAIKEIRFPNTGDISTVYSMIEGEISILEQVNHPNVLGYHGLKVYSDRVYLFTEYCSEGALSRYIIKKAGIIDEYGDRWERLIQYYTYNILKGLQHLHSKNIAHCDLKPENILLAEMAEVKIGDFGTAKMLNSDKKIIYGTKTKFFQSKGTSKTRGITSGTPMYMAPEIIKADKRLNTESFCACDIWSLGCIVSEMVTGLRPWENADNEWAIMYQIASDMMPNLPKPDEFSSDGIEFIKKCFIQEPTKRPTAADLLNDPWIDSCREIFEEQDAVKLQQREATLRANQEYNRQHYSQFVDPNQIFDESQEYNQNQVFDENQEYYGNQQIQ